jgi:squalene-hopene/tetraprenyl-beta-curcumene cyclase
MRWLIAATDEGRRTPPSPIGLYFARLWYFEEMYPIVFGLAGLVEMQALLDREHNLGEQGASRCRVAGSA